MKCQESARDAVDRGTWLTTAMAQILQPATVQGQQHGIHNNDHGKTKGALASHWCLTWDKVGSKKSSRDAFVSTELETTTNRGNGAKIVTNHFPNATTTGEDLKQEQHQCSPQ
jgi:hypothetical protein